MEKYHKQDVAPIEKENERDEKYKSDNPQIDSERTRNNYRFTPYFGKTYTEFINGRIKELGLSPRKDAVVMNSFVLGSDKTFFDGLVKIEQYNFFSGCYKFFAERYGEENIIAAVVHNDETTPHMHLNFIPINEGRLSSKSLFDRQKLAQLQTELHENIGRKWGLQRGKEGSQAKHLSTAEFKAKKIIESAEQREREIDEQTEKKKAELDDLTQTVQVVEDAKNKPVPKKRKDAEKEIVSLRTINAEQARQLQIVGKDRDYIFSLLKQKEQEAERYKRSAEILIKLKEFAPDELTQLQRLATERKEQKTKPPTSSNNSKWTK